VEERWEGGCNCTMGRSGGGGREYAKGECAGWVARRGVKGGYAWDGWGGMGGRSEGGKGGLGGVQG